MAEAEPKAADRGESLHTPSPEEALTHTECRQDADLTFATARRTSRSSGRLSAVAALFAAASAGFWVEPRDRLIAGAVALVLGVVSLARQSVGERFTQVSLARTTGVLKLTAGDGATVELPPGTVSRVVCFRHVATSRSNTPSSSTPNQHITWKLGIHKRDGGYLEALTFPEEDEIVARDAAIELESAAGRILEPATAGEVTDALASLRAVRAITVTTRAQESAGYRSTGTADVVEFAWAAPIALPRVGAILGAIAGMAVVFHAFSQAPGGGGAIVGAWLMAAIGVVVLLFFASTLGLRIHVTVDDAALTVERRRFGRRVRKRRWPIERVRAIDYTTGAGPVLAVRLADEGSSGQRNTDSNADEAGIPNVLAARTIPTGALTMTECIQLDLALSAEIARRKRVNHGEV